ncbi:MAG TPA: RpiB/LacA/LacB family sugar-phosphate isomerase [Pyrinomonadaceae bacterium]|nr:RpiB/LacA/LacB family sugar-phosphate isomerase [Pyrinomonadaceae bacterium]
MPDNAARDRIRALVRDVLDKTLPDGAQSGLASNATSSRFIDTVPKSSAISETTNVHDESSKTVITEDDVRDLADGAVLRISESARLTPLAADIVNQKKIEIIHRVPRRGSKSSRLIAVGADHGGFKMKEELKSLLTALGHQVHDFGTNSEDPVDYPDLAYAVARSVSEGTSELGIIIDGAGVGSAITANKVPGIRAAACYSVAVARNSREHNGANVLSLGSKTISSAEMRDIVQAWLATEITEERHLKRVGKIAAIERQYRR